MGGSLVGVFVSMQTGIDMIAMSVGGALLFVFLGLTLFPRKRRGVDTQG